MPSPRMYTVVLQPDALSILESLVAEDIALTQDVESLEHNLSLAPHAAGVLKSSGYYIGRRGAVEIKYSVSDEDRLVKIIGVRRCAHPFDVVLSVAIQEWFTFAFGALDSELAMDAIRYWTPLLRRNPRLVGRRSEANQYRDTHNRVSILFEINEPNCLVTIMSINVE